MTPDSERRNSTAMYNPMLVSELKENYPMFNWATYFDAVFMETGVTVGDEERIIVVQPDYFQATQAMEASSELLGDNLDNEKPLKIIQVLFSQLFVLEEHDGTCRRSYPGVERHCLQLQSSPDRC